MFIGALGLIMGNRSDSSAIFLSDEKCVVEAEFGSLSDNRIVQLALFEDFDIAHDSLTIRREISASGKSRAFINDTPVTLDVLKSISGLLLDLHGQHENVALLSHDSQLDLLDEYAGTQSDVLAFGKKVTAQNRLHQRMEEIRRSEADARRQMDFIQFQVKELEAANLRENEEEELEQELMRLQNAEDIRNALSFATETLYNQENALYAQMNSVLTQLRKIAVYDAGVNTQVELLTEAQHTLRESTFSLQHILEQVEANPEHLANLEARLGLYHSLKMKYAVRSAAELLELLASLRNKIAEVESVEETLAGLQRETDALAAELIALGESIETRRRAAADTLAHNVNSLLTEVGFKQAQFAVELSHTTKPTAKGYNTARFMIQTNAGLPLSDLSSTASGGEISRVMLAIKAAMADKAEFPVLIFDEIDTGISGEIANKVGDVMRRLAERFQLFTITHLPQIAAKGTEHFEIYKAVHAGRTSSSVRRMETEERVDAIARMISGDNPTEAARNNARELMRVA